jgi:hypothetical protein
MWGAAGILVGSLMVVICLTSYLAYVILRSRQTSGPAQTNAAQTSPSPEVLAQVNNRINAPDQAMPKASQPPRRLKNDKSRARDEDTAADLTRGENAVPNLKLREVKKVYIEIRGAETDDELRRSLIKRLNSSGVVTVATNADEADAALKIVVSQTSTSALLVNARGTVLWPKAGGARHYSGENSKVVSEIVKDLLSEIR